MVHLYLSLFVIHFQIMHPFVGIEGAPAFLHIQQNITGPCFTIVSVPLIKSFDIR